MGRFCGVEVPSLWREGDTKPIWQPNKANVAAQFLEFLDSLISDDAGLRANLAGLAEDTALSNLYGKEKWATFVNQASKIFRKALESWNEEIAQLKEAWDQVPLQPSIQKGRFKAMANAIGYQARTLCDITVIEWLADCRFLTTIRISYQLTEINYSKAW